MDYEKKQEIPFGVFDSELMEATYFIPQGYHAVIDGNKVIIKKGEDPVSNDLDSFAKEYSFNIPSDIYNLLPKEKQSSWIIEIENAVKAGAQWQKEQMIDKACKWLNNFYSEDRHCYFVEEDIDNFKRAMEE
jgi:hypothetical protein